MAATCARRTLLISSSSASLFRSFSSSRPTALSSETPLFSRFSRHKLPSISRLPVELGCAQSLMPLHSVTASALLTSMLSLKVGNWGWLSEGPDS
ncbi:protein NUCLEAR FUSION DEFECTIVE 6, mitochondrial isoform X2 [Tasmannia lanceolata]|uniref:protein NUCLEAR FUSION DEFECTIVE 6, mitochondrial isoform X2 n=1 Tax=Tasmannia lanceolata TaxID=3420 RepID=UPI004062B0BD